MIFPIKAVIFDADGVLLDSLSVWKELGRRYITDLGYQPVAEMDEILFPMSMEQGADWLKNRFTLAYSEEKIVMDLKSRIRKYYFEEVPAKSGATEPAILLIVCGSGFAGTRHAIVQISATSGS